MPKKRRTKPPRPARVLLAAKRARRSALARGVPRRVVFRDTLGQFAKRSARSRQGVQVVGKGKGVYATPKRRGAGEVADAIADALGGGSRTYSSATTHGTMADRVLLSVNASGEPLAFAFSRGMQSGVVTVTAEDVSFVAFFGKSDLQLALADILSAYFVRAHATRQRVSAKARAGKGSHAEYALVRSVRIVVKLD